MDMTADQTLQESCMSALRHMGVEVTALADKANRLEDENTDLRELAADMWNELDAATQYDAGGGRGILHEFADRMRKLGIEVEDG